MPYELFRTSYFHNSFYAPLRSVLNMCHWHIAPWHHVMYRKKELAVCSASSFKQKIKSAEGGTWTRTVLLPQAPEACASANSATSAFRKNIKLYVARTLQKEECGRRDLNPHGIATTGTWSLRVCQFRHFRVLFLWSWLATHNAYTTTWIDVCQHFFEKN